MWTKITAAISVLSLQNVRPEQTLLLTCNKFYFSCSSEYLLTLSSALLTPWPLNIHVISMPNKEVQVKDRLAGTDLLFNITFRIPDLQ